MPFRRYLNELLSLISFLTIIPTGRISLEEAASGFYLVPLVGLMEGLIASLPFLLGKSLLSAVLSISLLYFITGFNHVDGFLDFAEAAISRTPNPVAVLKDTHRGSFAIAAGTVLFAVLASAFYSTDLNPIVQLLESSLASSFSMYVLASIGKPTESGLGKLFVMASKDWPRRIVALILYEALSFMVFGSPILLAVVTVESFASAYLTHVIAMRRMGFINGDVLGFTYELALMITASTMAYLPFPLFRIMFA